jgi:hypothetical protein
MEENISRLAGATSGEYLSPGQFHERIRELGRVPAERNTTYTKFKLYDDSQPPQAWSSSSERPGAAQDVSRVRRQNGTKARFSRLQNH